VVSTQSTTRYEEVIFFFFFFFSGKEQIYCSLFHNTLLESRKQPFVTLPVLE
jgi:hypothetical protein